MLKQCIIDQLRRMFIDGATPSELMQYIAQKHKDDSRLHFIITDYFREAFCIPLLRNVVSEEDYSPASRHAHYNRDVAPEIVERIDEWNHENLAGSWLDGLSVNSLAEHTQRLKEAHFEELDRVWHNLNDKERHFIIRKIAIKDYYWEVAKMLAAMAERLQQKVVDLEARLKKEHRVHDAV